MNATARILVHAGAAMVAALIVNLGLFFLGGALGADFVVPQGPDQTRGALPASAVVLVTVTTMAAGTLVLLGLRRLLPRRAFAIFLGLGALLFLVSLAPLAGGISASTRVFLGLMHVATPAILIYALSRARRG